MISFLELVADHGFSYGFDSHPELAADMDAIAQDVRSTIPKCTFVDCSDVYAMLPRSGKGPTETLVGPGVYLPWDSAWFDFGGAAAVCRRREDKKIDVVIISNVVHPLRAVLLAGMILEEGRDAAMSDDGFLNMSFGIVTDLEEAAPGVPMAGLLTDLVAALFYVLRMLCCRNVGVEPGPPEPGASPAAARRFGKHASGAGYRFHTITIRAGSGETRPLSDVIGPGRDVPLHVVRGHFKHYSTDRPLFGKFSGWWWWGPQARGKERFGVVDKDYRIAADKQPEPSAPTGPTEQGVTEKQGNEE